MAKVVRYKKRKNSCLIYFWYSLPTLFYKLKIYELLRWTTLKNFLCHNFVTLKLYIEICFAIIYKNIKASAKWLCKQKQLRVSRKTPSQLKKAIKLFTIIEVAALLFVPANSFARLSSTFVFNRFFFKP